MSIDGINQITEYLVACPRGCGAELVVTHEDLPSEYRMPDGCACGDKLGATVITWSLATMPPYVRTQLDAFVSLRNGMKALITSAPAEYLEADRAMREEAIRVTEYLLFGLGVEFSSGKFIVPSDGTFTPAERETIREDVLEQMGAAHDRNMARRIV